MSTLDENAIRALLPKPNVQVPVQPPSDPTEPAIPGTIVNTNPPAQGSGDALIFDPDENITYDSLQTMQTTGNEIPFVPQYSGGSAPVASTPNVLDLAPAPTTAASTMVSNLKYWVILVACILILSFIGFFLMRRSPKPASNMPPGMNLNQIYGGR